MDSRQHIAGMTERKGGMTEMEGGNDAGKKEKMDSRQHIAGMTRGLLNFGVVVRVKITLNAGERLAGLESICI